MKELEIKPQDAIEIREEQQQKKEVKLIGQQRRVPGLTLWEYHTIDKTLVPATFKKQDIVLNTLLYRDGHKNVFHQKVEVKESCIYFQALNKKSARKKLKFIKP